MFRPSSRLVAAVLWLVIALLPLRVVAAGWMSPGMVAAPAASVTADAMPCHGMASAAADEAASNAPSHHACTLCDLCHAGVTVAPEPHALALHAAGRASLAVPASPHGRVMPDGLFRPPR
jgi:hypothetical protein